MLETHPERVIQQAVKGMLPHNRLGRKLLRHLKVYGGPDHPHAAQVNAGRGKAKSEAAGKKASEE
jgi:ribosomal protein L13